ncbi:MAG: isoprenylcysteine carboxylmethyltransferase family protein [Pseudomonadota bacterium]
MSHLKWLDLPPLWLVLFACLAWIQSTQLPIGSLGGAWADFLGGLLVGAGILLAVLAVMEMRKAQTTPIPHMAPSALVTTGIFSRSRNPIYLGDVLILLGLILWWDAVPSLILVPLFVWVITDRFIGPEEGRLHAAFGTHYETYKRQVRRWI